MLLNSLPYFLHVRLLETTLSTEDASIKQVNENLRRHCLPPKNYRSLLGKNFDTISLVLPLNI